MDETVTVELTVNGISYRRPRKPIVVVCVDGGDATYYEQGLKDGILPNLRRFMGNGFSDLADGVVPSFTNPNNLSIVTAHHRLSMGSREIFFWNRKVAKL